ncbi:MAG: hypothetical protein R3D44_01410 [Hyphomicrobiaceae bacterium]
MATKGEIQPSHGGSAVWDPPSLAVVPYFSVDGLLTRGFTTGVTLRVTEILGSVGDLRVTSASSAMNLPRSLSIPQIGQQLGVDYVLRGQILRSEQTLYFTQWLYEARTGALIVEHEVECGLGQLEEFERDVLARVVADVRLPLKENEIDRIMERRPRNASAYALTLRAQVAMCSLQRRSFYQAKRLLTSALAKDPRYAMAYAWLARFHSILIGQGWSKDRRRDVREAKRLAEIAIELDPQNAIALATAGHLSSYLERDYARGECLLRRAIKCCPNEPLGYLLLSATLAYTGRALEGRKCVEYALTLSPLDSQLYFFNNFAAVCCYAEGDYAMARKYALRSERQNPHYSTTLKALAVSCVGLGEVSEAREAAKRLRWLEPTFNEKVARTTVPFQDPVLCEQYIRQLRTAGCFDSPSLRRRRRPG